MSAKQLAREISEGLRENGFEVNEVDAWPVSDHYLNVSSSRSDYAGIFRLTSNDEIFVIDGRDQPVLDAIREMGFKPKKDKKRTIFVAFEIITPGPEEGNVEERGEISEDEITPYYDETFASAAVKYLRDNGAYPSGGDCFETGSSTDYGTGEEENRSFHLRGFTDEEEALIWTEMERKTRHR
jgi:hypothetical protein